MSFLCLATFRLYELRRDAIELAKKAKWDDEGPQRAEAEGDGGGGVAARDSQVGDLITIKQLGIFIAKKLWLKIKDFIFKSAILIKGRRVSMGRRRGPQDHDYHFTRPVGQIEEVREGGQIALPQRPEAKQG